MVLSIQQNPHDFQRLYYPPNKLMPFTTATFCDFLTTTWGARLLGRALGSSQEIQKGVSRRGHLQSQTRLGRSPPVAHHPPLRAPGAA